MMIVIRLIILVLLYVNAYCSLIHRDSDSNSIINVNNIIDTNHRKLLEDIASLSTEKKEDIIVQKEEKVVEHAPVVRTATGGFIHTIMVFLTIVSFIGNGAFMVYVFWLSR